MNLLQPICDDPYPCAHKAAPKSISDDLIGISASFRKAIERLPALAFSNDPVLITGETGTGKDLVARKIHSLSERRGGPLVVMNCGGVPESLLMDELFGHERGAYTDARAAREGLISQADGGTFFLDEVQALPPCGQAALLRVVEEQIVRPFGSNSGRRVNVRFIAATNALLPLLVEKGMFRRDLFYRIEVLMLNLPPLREREGDVSLLSDHFIRKYRQSQFAARLTEEARTAMIHYPWPGNVRQLENVIRRVANVPGESIELPHLGLPTDAIKGTSETRTLCDLPFRTAKRIANDHFERSYFESLMGRHTGNRSSASRSAGLDRRDLRRFLQKHRLDSSTTNKCPPLGDSHLRGEG